MSKLETLIKTRAGKKQSFTKKLNTLEEALRENQPKENLHGMVSDINNKTEDLEEICRECEGEDPENAQHHREWMQDIYRRREEILDKVSLKSIEDDQITQNSHKWEEEVRKKRDNVMDQLKTTLNLCENSNNDANDSIIEEINDRNAIKEEKERKIMIERDTIEGHLRRLIEKASSLKVTATENQLSRLKEKIKIRAEEAENKNTEFLLINSRNENTQRRWITKILDDVDDAIEAIDSQMDKLREMNTRNQSHRYDLSQQNISYKTLPQTISTNSKPSEATSDLIKLKKINLPAFSGNKKEFPAWRATFAEFVDKTEKSPEYKLLQLKEVLQGEAAQVTNGLGYSREAYECAMARLERKFGGSRREKTLILEEVSAFSPIRENSPEDLDKFADLLENLVLNFQGSDRAMELGSGMLFVTLQQKLPVSVLTSYQRWVFEGKREESILTLKDFIMQEAQYHVIASETTKGISNGFTPSVSTCQTQKCTVCGGLHHIDSCKEFLKMKLSARKTLVFKMKLCFKCLRHGHQANNCDLQEVDKHKVLQRKEKPHQTPCVNSAVRTNTFTLRIIPIIVKNNEKEIKINALLDDGSQQTFINKTVTSYLGVTESDQKDIDVSLLGGRIDTLKGAGSVSLSVMPIERNTTYTISALTTTQVTGDLRGRKWENVKGKYHHLHDIPLEEFCSQRVDMIIGLDNPELHVSLEERVGNPGEPMARKTPLGWSLIGPVEHSILEKPNTQFVRMHFLQNQSELHEINKSVQRMWEIEEFPDCKDVIFRSKVDENILRETKNSMEKTEGRYRVKIPWNKNKAELQLNTDTAIKRLACTEKQLIKKKEVGLLYTKNIDEYIKKGYIRKIRESEHASTKYLMPHFPVTNMTKDTTKVRVVFDASSKENGISLNDAIDPGPNLQKDLMDILLRFRKNAIAIVADISEMFLQVELAEADRPYHRFLWRNMDVQQDPQIYEFSRLVFGESASPFLAQLVAMENATEYKNEFPRAVESITKSTYMDDTLDSLISDKEGINLYFDLKTIWKKAGMEPHKWLTNSKDVLEVIPIEERARKIDLESSIDCKTKTLGLTWHADSDLFVFEIVEVIGKIQTKRMILKHTAAIFDPLGLISPLLIQGKIIVQDTWRLGLDWDEKIPDEIAIRVENFFEELKELSLLKFSRYVKYSSKSECQLHIFTDSSEEAYAAVAYFKVVDSVTNNVTVNLVCSKAKVCPLKSISMPRLELTAAELGVKLASKICNAMDLDIKQVTFWCDSKDALGWIFNESRNFHAFVAHKISKIQLEVDSSQWRYVPSRLNPADIATRGNVQVKQLLQPENMWLNGPEFLKLTKEHWPHDIAVSNCLPERKNEKKQKSLDYRGNINVLYQENIIRPSDNSQNLYLSNTTKRNQFNTQSGHRMGEANLVSRKNGKIQTKIKDEKINSASNKTPRAVQFDTNSGNRIGEANLMFGVRIENQENGQQVVNRLDPRRYSSFMRLLRVRSWINRYLTNSLRKDNVMTGPLSSMEIENSKTQVIKETQQEAFSEEIKSIVSIKGLKKSSTLSSLNTFLDANNILRSNSRLVNAKKLTWNAKHPIVLPRNHHVTDLIIREVHGELHHVGGTNHALAVLSREYWIVSAREAIRKVENNCNECKIRKAKIASQIMSPLPKFRINGSLSAFSSTGCDFAGPFTTIQGRGKTRSKRYLCLFTCLEVRAIHLEMCYSLDTDSFINAFWRFTSRRGIPKNMCTDNGRNFISAEKELRPLLQALDFSRIKDKTSHKGINWKFNPPYEPHSGGIFEVMVKAAKRSMKAQIGSADIRDEELHTVIVMTEGLLNSRPITYQTANPHDLLPLTPNHFLYGRAGEDISIPVSGNPTIRRWRRLHELVNNFWKRWMTELIPSLAGRKKWKNKEANVAVGDIALLVSPDSERGKWPLGIITECTRSADDHVRRVKIKVNGVDYDRGIQHICPLEFH